MTGPALDLDRLATWLTRQLVRDGATVDAPVTIEALPGPASGNSNITVPFTAHWSSNGTVRTTELVLRMQVPTNQIFLDTDVLREHRVLSALEPIATFPTPAPRGAEPDPTVLGQPFFVMERVHGVVPAGTPSIHVTGWLSRSTPDECRTAWGSSMDAVAAIHDVDWRSVVPFLADGANGTTLDERLAHISRWYEHACAGREYPVTDGALRYLRATRPRMEAPPTLVWGDARIGNLIFGADHQVAAVLDWELASIGPPEIDLGWWLAMDEFQTDAHGIEPLPGYPSRDETIAAYEQRTGRAVEHVRWFEVLCAFVLTVTVIRMADIAVADGRLAADNRMGHGNLTAQMLARWLDLPVPDLDAAYATRRGLDAQG